MAKSAFFTFMKTRFSPGSIEISWFTIAAQAFEAAQYFSYFLFPMKEISFSVATVSYTHLDVYKRQILKMKLDILAFGAHPDDVELGCSGTIAKEISLGKKVGIIDLTRGELGTRGSVEIRNSESAKACLLYTSRCV